MGTWTRTSSPTRRLLLAAAGSAVLIRPARADPLSDGRLRADVAGILRTTRVGSEIIPDDDPEQLRVGPVVIALVNLYRHVADLSGADRRRAIGRCLAVSL